MKQRVANGLRQLIMFGVVGASGVVVNWVVLVLVRKFFLHGLGILEHDVLFPIYGTNFNVRWFNVYMVVAFLLANIWNYQLNRMWTFKGSVSRSWLRGFFPFLLTGLGALVVSLAIANLLMNPTSPIGLPTDIFDDSSGFRTRIYWANAISTLVAMPVNFLINKVWTFRSAPKGTKVVEETVAS